MQEYQDRIIEIFSNEGLLKHLWAFCISLLGGVVAHFERIQDKNHNRFMFMLFLYDLAASSFIGLVALYTCLSLEVGIYMTGVVISVSAHSGTKALSLLLKFVAGKYKVSININSTKNKDVR